MKTCEVIEIENKVGFNKLEDKIYIEKLAGKSIDRIYLSEIEVMSLISSLESLRVNYLNRKYKIQGE